LAVALGTGQIELTKHHRTGELRFETSSDMIRVFLLFDRCFNTFSTSGFVKNVFGMLFGFFRGIYMVSSDHNEVAEDLRDVLRFANVAL